MSGQSVSPYETVLSESEIFITETCCTVDEWFRTGQFPQEAQEKFESIQRMVVKTQKLLEHFSGLQAKGRPVSAELARIKIMSEQIRGAENRLSKEKLVNSPSSGSTPAAAPVTPMMAALSLKQGKSTTAAAADAAPASS